MHIKSIVLLVCFVAMAEGIRFRWLRFVHPYGYGKRQYLRSEEKSAEDAFDILDGNHDGVIDMVELKKDLQTVLQGETRTPEQLMLDADTNGDGKIEEDEFIAEMGNGETEDLFERYSGDDAISARRFNRRHYDNY